MKIVIGRVERIQVQIECGKVFGHKRLHWQEFQVSRVGTARQVLPYFIETFGKRIEQSVVF